MLALKASARRSYLCGRAVTNESPHFESMTTKIGMTNAGKVSVMKDALWVFKSFGIKAGILFMAGAVAMKFKRLFGLAKKPKRFEELSDEEAKQVAWAFGIFQWQDRQDLNEKIGNNDERTLH